MAATDNIAIIGAATAAVVGVGGLAFGWWNSDKERRERTKLSYETRRHERQLAQDARLYESRSRSYEEMLNALGHIQLYLELAISRIELLASPLDQVSNLDIQPADDSDDEGMEGNFILRRMFTSPPEPPNNVELLRLAARLATFGSAVIHEAAEEYLRKAYDLAQDIEQARRNLYIDAPEIYAPEIQLEAESLLRAEAKLFHLTQEFDDAVGTYRSQLPEESWPPDIAEMARAGQDGTALRLEIADGMKNIKTLLRDTPGYESLVELRRRYDRVMADCTYWEAENKRIREALREQLSPEDYKALLTASLEPEHVKRRKEELFQLIFGEDYMIIAARRDALEEKLRFIQQSARDELAVP